MNEDIARILIQYINKEYLDEGSGDTITPETKLISSGIIDSFSMVSLKVFIEKKFQISIPDHEATAEAFDSVASILKLIKTAQQSK